MCLQSHQRSNAGVHVGKITIGTAIFVLASLPLPLVRHGLLVPLLVLLTTFLFGPPTSPQSLPESWRDLAGVSAFN